MSSFDVRRILSLFLSNRRLKETRWLANIEALALSLLVIIILKRSVFIIWNHQALISKTFLHMGVWTSAISLSFETRFNGILNPTFFGNILESRSQLILCRLMCCYPYFVKFTLSFKVLNCSLFVCIVNLSQSQFEFDVIHFSLRQFRIQEISIFESFYDLAWKVSD